MLEYKAKIQKTFDEGASKAIADVTVNDEIAIHGIRLMVKDGSPYLSMPSQKWTDKTGNTKYSDQVHPITAEGRKAMLKAVVDAYNQHMQQSKNEPVLA